jgi:hypothetical protein
MWRDQIHDPIALRQGRRPGALGVSSRTTRQAHDGAWRLSCAERPDGPDPPLRNLHYGAHLRNIGSRPARPERRPRSAFGAAGRSPRRCSPEGGGPAPGCGGRSVPTRTRHAGPLNLSVPVALGVGKPNPLTKGLVSRLVRLATVPPPRPPRSGLPSSTPRGRRVSGSAAHRADGRTGRSRRRPH